MFLALSSRKETLINLHHVIGRLPSHLGYASARRTIKPISLLFLLAQLSATQSLAEETGGRMSIEYGIVSTYHSVEWDHPQLPINIVRGAPPVAIENANEDTASSGSADSNQARMVGGDNGDDTDEQDAPETPPAILYEIDLGEQGMLSIISSQRSVEPGHCAAIERGEDYLNLRRVHVEFCNPANRPLTKQLARYRRDIATLCQMTKSRATDGGSADETAQHHAQVRMLCDE